MPNPESKIIPVWPYLCKIETADSSSVIIATQQDENCILQVIGSGVAVCYKDQEYVLNAQRLLMLGRRTTAELIAQKPPIRYMLLRYRHTFSAPSFDLNHACLQNPSVDTFMGGKGRFCILEDRDNIHLTLTALHDEWEHHRPEKDSMIRYQLYELFIRMARSFHHRNQPIGIQRLRRACAYIQDNYQHDLKLDEVAAMVGVSRSYLTMLFKKYMKRTFVNYVQAVRCDRAAYLLKTSSFAVVDIAAEAGFNSRQHFTRTFSRIYGMTPNSFRLAYHAVYQRSATDLA